MSFTFDPDQMRQDLQALSKAAGAKFLANQSQDRMERLWTGLEHGVANAASGGAAKFTWGTEEGRPIQIRESKSWKGDTDDSHPMAADLRFDYQCEVEPGAARLRANGVAVMTLRDVGSGGQKVVHFDAEEGGWQEVRDGKVHGRAGHPPLHAQFHGIVNDIPRMPTIIVYPVDVICFAILELHQKHWRKHAGSHEYLSRVRHVPTRQRTRLRALLDRWNVAISATDVDALVAMQRRFAQPLAL